MAFRQAQRQRGVIGPLAGFEPERPAAKHIANRFKRAARLEFDGGPDSITAG